MLVKSVSYFECFRLEILPTQVEKKTYFFLGFCLNNNENKKDFFQNESLKMLKTLKN